MGWGEGSSECGGAGSNREDMGSTQERRGEVGGGRGMTGRGKRERDKQGLREGGGEG